MLGLMEQSNNEWSSQADTAVCLPEASCLIGGGVKIRESQAENSLLLDIKMLKHSVSFPPFKHSNRFSADE